VVVRGDWEGRAAMEEKASSPLVPPPSEIDLEVGGGGEQLQCRICLETDGEGGSDSRVPLLAVFFFGVPHDCFGRDGRVAEI
jgi:hypothetical protein